MGEITCRVLKTEKTDKITTFYVSFPAKNKYYTHDVQITDCLVEGPKILIVDTWWNLETAGLEAKVLPNILTDNGLMGFLAKTKPFELSKIVDMYDKLDLQDKNMWNQYEKALVLGNLFNHNTANFSNPAPLEITTKSKNLSSMTKVSIGFIKTLNEGKIGDIPVSYVSGYFIIKLSE